MLNKYSELYLLDALIRFAHNSTAIEGNTLTLEETRSIIEFGEVPKAGTTLRELYEVENHKRAFKFLFDTKENNTIPTQSLVREIHSILLNNIAYDNGKYKENSNYIVGASFNTSPPLEVPQRMQQSLDNTNYRLERANSFDEKLEIILENHIEFERIHPFSDGNGRTGRTLLNYYLMLENSPLLVINKEDKKQYITFLNNRDVKGFKAMAQERLIEEQDRLNYFIALEKGVDNL